MAADDMDKVTQQNAAMVEETTAAAQSLSAETEDLSLLVGKFRIGRPEARSALPVSGHRSPAAGGRASITQMRTGGGKGGAAHKPDESSEDWADF